MNTIKKYLKQIVIGVLICLVVCGSFVFNKYVKADNSNENDYSKVVRDTSIKVDETTGNLNITRNKKQQNNTDAEDEWTILIYMDGADLESNFGYATKDLQEMMSAKIFKNTVDKVNIVVQTGGSSLWYLYDVDGSKSQRFIIDTIGGPTLLEETDDKNMGDPQTLYDFVSWGVEKYPAKKTGLIFWNHGSGVSNGVCGDYKYNDDALMLPEVEYALAKANKNTNSQFEFIGFDACLSGSVEYANALAPYTRYMIASADFEPGTGWEYKSVLNQILENPTSTGLEVGKVVCDSYYDELVKLDKNAKPTMALYDLAKVDELCNEINNLSRYMYDQLLKDEGAYTRFGNMQNAMERITYGMDKENMDIGSLVYYFDVSCDYTYDTTNIKKALDDFIVHKKIASIYDKYKAVGLSLYYPTKTLNLKELNVLRNATFSPYHLKYIEFLTYLRQGKEKNKYQSIDWENSEFFFEKDFSFLKYYRQKDIDDKTMKDILSQNYRYASDGFADRWVSNFVASCSSNVSYQYYDPYSPYTHRSIDVKSIEGNYVADVKEDYRDSIIKVYNSIFTYIGDDLVCLGEDNSVTYNANTGEITSNFNGEWWMLPDGQLLTVDVNEGLDETIYSIPVYVNNMEMTIKIRKNISSYNETTYETLGLWDAVSTSNYEGRGYIPLERGMKITPIYNVYNSETEQYESEYGEEYTIASDFDFLLGQLEENEYKFAFALEEINGKVSYSKTVDYIK